MPELMSADNLRFNLDGSGRMREVSFSLGRGRAIRIVGPSGWGKTTLLKVLARLRPAEGGLVTLENKSWLDIPPERWRTSVAMLAQHPVMLDGTVEDNLLAGSLFKTNRINRPDHDEAVELLARLGLDQKILTEKASVISGGEKARAALVRALLLKPKIIMADEPLAHLDKEAGQAALGLLSEYLDQNGAGLIAVSHQDLGQILTMEEVELESGSPHN